VVIKVFEMTRWIDHSTNK